MIDAVPDLLGLVRETLRYLLLMDLGELLGAPFAGLASVVLDLDGELRLLDVVLACGLHVSIGDALEDTFGDDLGGVAVDLEELAEEMFQPLSAGGEEGAASQSVRIVSECIRLANKLEQSQELVVI